MKPFPRHGPAGSAVVIATPIAWCASPDQERTTELLQARLSVEPYGLAIDEGQPDLVRFVNGVLDRMRADATLTGLESKWLGALRDVGVTIPPIPDARIETDVSILELDQERERLAVTSEHIGENLMELERDPTREMLGLAVLDGVTATRWAAADQGREQLWGWFAKLTSVLDEAKQVRGTRRSLSPAQEHELRDLLTGPSIELSTDTVPIHLRQLDDARRPTSRCTPDQLIEMMTRAFNELRDVVAATQFAWDQLVPRVATARAALDELANEPRGLDAELAPELARLRPRLDELGRTLMADPVAADAAEVDRIEAEIRVLRDDVTGAVSLRDELDAQLEHADAVLAEVRDATQRALDAHDEVSSKIVDPAVPVPAPMARDLADGVTRVRELAARGQWRAARTELDEWTDRAETALQRARDDAARNRAPIDERNELRGRLDGYKAKATAYGLLEDRAVNDAYGAASDELHTAPTDLARAHELVRHYQRAVSGDLSEKGPR